MTSQAANRKIAQDRFGNEIDPVVGFARGNIIKSSIDEARRLRQGQKVAADRVKKLGPKSIGIFTGNQRDFPLTADDIPTLCEEWVGPGLFASELNEVAVNHLGGNAEDSAAVFNRTSAGIIAAIAALTGGKALVSVVPPKGRSHASVIRGAKIAGVALSEIDGDENWYEKIIELKPQLVIITTVTSALELLADNITENVVKTAHSVGSVVLIDDAYGARLRPVLHSGKAGLALGGDLAITNSDKAGLAGPRAGILAGRPNLVTAVSAKGAEFGMEARAPIAAGAMRSLKNYRPQDLLEEARSGRSLAVALAARLGEHVVSISDLGPMIDEQDILSMLCKRSGYSPDQISIVPCEATSALGLVLLRDAGILTVNTHGQPGARVSLRLKPTLEAIQRVGGEAAVVSAVDKALDFLAAKIDKPAEIAELIFGSKM